MEEYSYRHCWMMVTGYLVSCTLAALWMSSFGMEMLIAMLDRSQATLAVSMPDVFGFSVFLFFAAIFACAIPFVLGRYAVSKITEFNRGNSGALWAIVGASVGLLSGFVPLGVTGSLPVVFVLILPGFLIGCLYFEFERPFLRAVSQKDV